MSDRGLLGSLLLSCLLAACFLGLAASGSPAGAEPSSLKPSAGSKSKAAWVARRARTRWIPLPIGPSYIYYDYPYYYSRGYYPTHIPGYAYYTFYHDGSAYHRRSAAGCSHSRTRRCVGVRQSRLRPD